MLNKIIHTDEQDPPLLEAVEKSSPISDNASSEKRAIKVKRKPSFKMDVKSLLDVMKEVINLKRDLFVKKILGDVKRELRKNIIKISRESVKHGRIPPISHEDYKILKGDVIQRLSEVIAKEIEKEMTREE